VIEPANEISKTDVNGLPASKPPARLIPAPPSLDLHPAQDPAANQLDPEKLLNLINQFRIKNGLTEVVKEPQLCQLAQDRSREIYSEIVVTHTMHQGLRNRNLPYRISENLIYMGSEEKALSWWINSPVHLKTLLSDNKYSCGACQGHSCSQLFTNYDPRPVKEASASAGLVTQVKPETPVVNN
jgi:uncharacterized protein YkwD